MHPEKHVCDEIDELMAQGLNEHGVPLDDYQKDRYVKCELCKSDWHGTANHMGCPGAWASEEDKQTWQSGASKSVDIQRDSDTAGSFVYDGPAGPGDSISAVYHDSSGREVRGTLVFNNPLGQTISPYTAIFIPEGSDFSGPEYRYVSTESDDSVSPRGDEGGYARVSTTWGEANEVEQAWDSIAAQTLSDINRMVAEGGDTP